MNSGICVIHPTHKAMIAATPDVLDALQNLAAAAGVVVANWQSGDLASAVRDLDAVAGEARAVIMRLSLRPVSA